MSDGWGAVGVAVFVEGIAESAEMRASKSVLDDSSNFGRALGITLGAKSFSLLPASDVSHSVTCFPRSKVGDGTNFGCV